MERLWNTGGKNWTYEYKYRRSGKTLCGLYAKSNHVGFMIIFGKDERAKFEAIRDTLSNAVCTIICIELWKKTAFSLLTKREQICG